MSNVAHLDCPDILIARDQADSAREAGEQPSAWAEKTIAAYSEWEAANPDPASRLDAAYAFQAATDAEATPEAG